jgi:hypothetical protein
MRRKSWRRSAERRRLDTVVQKLPAEDKKTSERHPKSSGSFDHQKPLLWDSSRFYRGVVVVVLDDAVASFSAIFKIIVKKN